MKVSELKKLNDYDDDTEIALSIPCDWIKCKIDSPVCAEVKPVFNKMVNTLIINTEESYENSKSNPLE